MSEALLKAVRIIGSRVKLANAIHVKVEVLKSWINNGICVPLEYAFEVQRVTHSEITWQEVSPHLAHFDKYWSFVDRSLSNFLPQFVTQISLSRIVVEDSDPRDFHEIHALSLDIQAHGLQRAICLDTENRLIFGKKRFYACQLLSKKTIACWRISLTDVLEGHYSTNELCKNFRWSERLAIALAVEKMIGNRQGQRSDLIPRQNFGEVSEEIAVLITKGRTHDLIVAQLGLDNRETYRQAKKIYLYGNRALVQAVDVEHISVLGAFLLLHLTDAQQEQVVTWQKTTIRKLLKAIKQREPLLEFNLISGEEYIS